MSDLTRNDIGQKYNSNDCFFRDLTISLLDTLEGKIGWTNRFSDKDIEVIVPFYYSLSGSEDFLLDSFTDDVVSNNRYVELNTDMIPRGSVTMTGYTIKSDEFRNPNVRLKVALEDKDEIKSVMAKIRPIPISVNYDITILVKSELDIFKCSESIMDMVWLYKFFYFEYNFMHINAFLSIPDTENIEIIREKNLTSDNTIKITLQLQVETYYPGFDKKVNNKDIISPKKTKWFGNIWGGKN